MSASALGAGRGLHLEFAGRQWRNLLAYFLLRICSRDCQLGYANPAQNRGGIANRYTSQWHQLDVSVHVRWQRGPVANHLSYGWNAFVHVDYRRPTLRGILLLQRQGRGNPHSESERWCEPSRNMEVRLYKQRGTRCN